MKLLLISSLIGLLLEFLIYHKCYYSFLYLYLNWERANTESVGLIISIVIDCSHYIHFLISDSGQLDDYLQRAERLYQYIHLPREGKEIDKLPPTNWPKNGEIILKNVSFQYPSSNTLLFENITLKIKPREKIGVCGRTGSGKSTLIKLLLRIVEKTNE